MYTNIIALSPNMVKRPETRARMSYILTDHGPSLSLGPQPLLERRSLEKLRDPRIEKLRKSKPAWWFAVCVLWRPWRTDALSRGQTLPKKRSRIHHAVSGTKMSQKSCSYVMIGRHGRFWKSGAFCAATVTEVRRPSAYVVWRPSASDQRVVVCRSGLPKDVVTRYSATTSTSSTSTVSSLRSSALSASLAASMGPRSVDRRRA
mmetsp:Transcript_16824/g.67889  ORF Transcript_16824/g.67889 Transcript_16824/m.67889 type:complete len:204 (+) Transcript_16824:1943-2554(+)